MREEEEAKKSQYKLHSQIFCKHDLEKRTIERLLLKDWWNLGNHVTNCTASDHFWFHPLLQNTGCASKCVPYITFLSSTHPTTIFQSSSHPTQIGSKLSNLYNAFSDLILDFRTMWKRRKSINFFVLFFSPCRMVRLPEREFWCSFSFAAMWPFWLYDAEHHNSLLSLRSGLYISLEIR